MVTEVALLEVQVRVEESPLLMELGFAWSETVGFAAGGGGAGGGGGACSGFLWQPNVKTAAARATTNSARNCSREAGYIYDIPPQAKFLGMNPRKIESHRKRHRNIGGLGATTVS
jgi:hypothetical protein